ncbi:hypothetical protein NDU88_005773, partial [Pleurodeles waltl]
YLKKDTCSKGILIPAGKVFQLFKNSLQETQGSHGKKISWMWRFHWKELRKVSGAGAQPLQRTTWKSTAQ